MPSGPPFSPPGADSPALPPSIPGNPAWIPPESIPTPRPEDTLSPQEIAAVNALIAQSGGGGPTEISDITGLTTALAGKAASSHTHTIANVTGLQAALDAKGTSNLVV